MDAILIGFAICVLGVMVTVLIFAIAMRPKPEEGEETPRPRLSPPPEHFFMGARAGEEGETEPPSNALLLELENHVRAEQGAAHEFLRTPTPESLHAPSESPLWH